MLPFYPANQSNLIENNTSPGHFGVRRVQRASGVSSKPLQALIVAVLLGVFLGGCASTSGELSAAQQEGQINLTIATSTLDHPPTTITVTIDGTLVATQPLTELSNGPKSHFIKIEPGHRELIARANTGRTKEVFPIFIHEEMEWLKLTYHCDCKGDAHPAKVAHFDLEQPQLPTDEVKLNQ